uniref:Protein AHNAK2 n=1 Tax=Ficedula albicollis TaxID=59894 RepID=A0A803VY33_FICAL
MPKISFPKIKGQKVQGSLPILETDVSGPKQEKECVSVQISEKGSSGEGAGLGIKVPKVTVPTLEFSKPEAKAPKIEMDVSMPTGEVTVPTCEDGLTLKSAAANASLSTSDIKMIPEGSLEVKSPDIIVERASTSGLPSDMSDPGVVDGKIKTPQTLTGGIEDAKADLSTQSVSKPKTEGIIERLEEKEIKLKEHEIKGEEVQTEEHQGWFKMPKFRIPAFGRSSLKEKKIQTETSIPENTFSLPHAVMEGDTSLSTERTESRMNIPKTETYADIVKRSAEGHTSEITVSAAELSKSYPSASETDKDKSSTNRFSTCTLTFPEHKGKSQDVEVPKVGSSMKLETSGVGCKPSTGEITLDATQKKIDVKASARITGETVHQTQGVPEVSVRIPKLKIPRFTFRTLPIEADVLLSKVVTDPKGSSTDIEIVQLQASPAIHEETGALEGGIKKAKSKILTLNEPDIKTAQMTATIESSLSSGGQDIHWSYIEGQEVREKVEPEHVAIERCEIYTTEILKGSEILSSEVKTATLGFSLLKTKLPESHSDLDVLVQKPSPTGDAPTGAGESFGVAAQRAGSAELKLSDKPHHESEESRGKVSLTKIKTSTAEVKCSSKLEESFPDKSPEGITAASLSKDEDVVEAVEGEEKDISSEKEKTDSKRSPGRFKFWLPSIGFSSSGDETSTDAKPEIKKSVPEDVKPADTSDDSSKQADKTGWFRFPKLGFTSPSKKAKSVDKEEVGHKEGRLSDEDSPTDKPDVFFDAQESLSPKEIGEGEKAEIDGASSIVTSSARTELILLEEEKETKNNRIISRPKKCT